MMVCTKTCLQITESSFFIKKLRKQKQKKYQLAKFDTLLHKCKHMIHI